MKYKFSIFRRALHFSCSKHQTFKNGDSTSNLPELNVQIETCGELYEKWRKENRYRKIPKGGLNFNIKYIDTSAVYSFRKIRDKEDRHKPIALALHGAPGSYRDFSRLTSHLHENGVRVIIPNLPDFTDYKPGIFRHSPEEKSQLIKDFLKKINVPKIDLLICHSGSIYPGLQLCVENDLPTIRSLVMLNPGAFDIVRAVRPYGIVCTFVQISEFSIGLKFLELIGPNILKLIKTPVRLDTMMDPLLSATTMCYADFPQAKENFKKVSEKLPILFAFGEDDKLIDKHRSYDVAYLLGANDSDIFLYDENGKLCHTGVETPFRKVMAFKEGSHYVFWKQPDIINEAVVSFMQKVLRK